MKGNNNQNFPSTDDDNRNEDEELETLRTINVRHKQENRYSVNGSSIGSTANILNYYSGNKPFINRINPVFMDKKDIYNYLISVKWSSKVDFIYDKDYTFKIINTDIKTLKSLEGLYVVRPKKIILITIIGKDFKTKWFDEEREYLQIYHSNKYIDIEDLELVGNEIPISVFNIYLKGSEISYVGEFTVQGVNNLEGREKCLILKRSKMC